MNMFNLDVTQKCLIAECWCPVGDLQIIQEALKRGTVSKDDFQKWPPLIIIIFKIAFLRKAFIIRIICATLRTNLQKAI